MELLQLMANDMMDFRGVVTAAASVMRNASRSKTEVKWLIFMLMKLTNALRHLFGDPLNPTPSQKASHNELLLTCFESSRNSFFELDRPLNFLALMMRWRLTWKRLMSLP
eukprot:6457657-Amphidinium_carterae.1